jgi:hypothetical protein
MFKNSADEGHQKKTTQIYICCPASPSVLKGHNRMMILAITTKQVYSIKETVRFFYQSMQFRIKNEGF